MRIVREKCNYTNFQKTKLVKTGGIV